MLLLPERNLDEKQAFHAERMEIEPINLTRIVDRLEDTGWVDRKSDPVDRRNRILHPSDEGCGGTA